MTDTIDGKVVEMKFDNSDFEKNVAQSMSTLDKLKQALNFDSGKSIQELGKATKGFNMDGVGSAVETVQAKFSALQVVGMTALSEITKSAMQLGSKIVSSIISPISSGGMNRALNIEQAKFQLEGLGVAWDDIVDDINYGVKDTAYGLDAAAKAASQLTASGVSMGDDMKSALRAISGVASMTSSTYEEISPIFTTVAGQGKLMTQQLRQLESRGLNAAATLADYLGTTEAEVRDLVTKGVIDFDTFAKAMDDAFGSHAKDANKTFTGAMSNMRAALSRIGANFATPYMENMRKVAVAATKVIDDINKAMGPIYQDVSGIMETVQEKLTYFLGSSGVKDGISSIVNAVRESFYALLLILTPIKEAFRDIFPKKDSAVAFRNMAKSIEEFTSKLVISEETASKIKDTFKGVFAVFDLVGQIFGAALNAILPFGNGIKGVGGHILDFTANLGRYLTELSKATKANDTFTKAFDKLRDVAGNVGDVVKSAFDKIIGAFKDFKANHIDDKDFGVLSSAFQSLKDSLSGIGGISGVIGKIFGGIKAVLESFAPVFKTIVGIISDTITQLLNGFATAFKGTDNSPFEAFINMFNTALTGSFLMSFTNLLTQVKKTVKDAGGLNTLILEFKNTLKTFQADIKADVLTKLAKAIAIFAGSLLILSLIDSGRLLQSMVAVEVLVETLKKFMASFEQIAGAADPKSMLVINSLGTTMIKLGAAVLVLAVAVKVLSSIDLIHLAAGVVAVIVLMNALADQAVLLSNIDTKVMKGASAMIALAIGVRILASAVNAMASLPLLELIKGVGATIAVMYALAGAMVVLDRTKVGAGTAIAMIALATSILILQKSVEAFGAMDVEKLKQGLIAVGLAIGAMTASLAIIGAIASGGTLVAASIAMIALAASIKILQSAVEAFANMNLDSLKQGLIAVGLAILALTLAITAISVASNPATLLAMSVAFIAFGAAITLLAVSLKLLSTIPIDDLKASFITLAVVIAAFAAASALLTPILPVMAALAGIVVLIGAGVLSLGLGVVALSAGLSALATACTVVVANLGAILTVIATLIPAIATALAQGIITFIVTIGEGATQIVNAIVELCEAILVGLTQLLPPITDLVVTFIKELLRAIVELVPEFVKAGVDLVTGIMKGLTESIPEFVDAGMKMIIAFMNGLADSIRENTPLMIDAADNLMDAFIEAIKMWFSHFVEKGGEIIGKIKEGLDEAIPELKEKGHELVENIKEAIKEKIADVVQLGKDLVSGFIEGIKAAPGKIVDAAKGVAKSAIDAIKDEQDSNSPSKVTEALGVDFADGYTDGIESKEGDVENASAGLADAATIPMLDANDTVRDDTADMASDVAGNLSFAQKAYEKLDAITAYTNRYGNEAKKAGTSTKDLRSEMKDLHKPTKDAADATKELSDQQDKLAGSSGRAGAAAKETKDIYQSLTDTISGQLDIFKKFELKTDVTAAQMLENMKSNLDGFRTWSSKLAGLAERGIDQALYQKLAEMGPNAYETVNAFATMTDEQLQQANQMWAESLSLPQESAQIVGDGFNRAGEMGVAGYVNAMSTGMTEMGQMSNEAAKNNVDEFNKGMGVASPSKETYLTGYYAVMGFRNGVMKSTFWATDAMAYMAQKVIARADSALKPSIFYDIGAKAMEGLKNGINDNASGPIKAAEEVAKSVISIIKGALEVHSPSRVTEGIGRYVSEGLAIGITKAAGNVYRAAEKVADGAIESMSINGQISDALSSDLDFNPIITPMLDLSYMREQIASIGSMFSNPTFGLNGQNGGQFTANPNGTGNQINFTQNNYSPKELSRMEIYRQTKNQINMMKGVVKANA